jgi:integrase
MGHRQNGVTFSFGMVNIRRQNKRMAERERESVSVSRVLEKPRELMRHESIETTMKYYVGVNAEATADELWRAIEKQPGTSSGTQPANAEEAASKCP